MSLLQQRKKCQSISNQNLHTTQRTLSKRSALNNGGNRSVSTFNLTSRQQQIKLPNKNFLNQQKASKSKQYGPSYKLQIQKRKKQKQKQQQKQQLFEIIQNFMSTLCRLPLNKLILNSNTQQWYFQQQQTYNKIKQRFYKLTSNNQKQIPSNNQKKISSNNYKQMSSNNQIQMFSNTQKHKQTYYHEKLISIEKVLQNIKQNLEMLNKMNVIKDYTSGGTSHQSGGTSHQSGGTSHISRNSNSEKDHIRNHMPKQTLIPNTNKNNNTNNTISKPINTNTNKSFRRFQTQSENQSKFKPIQQIQYQQYNQYNQFDNRSQPLSSYLLFQSREINETDKFVLNTVSQSKNNLAICQTVRSEASQEQQQTRRNNIGNYSSQQLFVKRQHLNTVQTINPFSKINPKSLKSIPKQVSLIQPSVNPTSLIQPKKIYNNFDSNQHQQTKRFLSNPSLLVQLQSVQKQLSMKNQIIIRIQEQNNKQIHRVKGEFQNKERQYLETIMKLKYDNQQKQNSLRQLLIQQAQRDDQIQLLQCKIKQHQTKITGLKAYYTSLQQTSKHLSQQVRQYKIRQQQLRQTVKLQRQRTKTQQLSIQSISLQLQQKQSIINNNQIKIRQLEQSIISLTNKLNQFGLQNGKQLKKEQIYKQKYFKVSIQFEKFKQNMVKEQQFWKGVCKVCKKDVIFTNKEQNQDKIIQIRQLIEYHKNRLIS